MGQKRNLTFYFLIVIMGKLKKIIIFCMLLFIAYLSIITRIKTITTDIPLDYDPWWFYRYAKYIVKNFDSGKGFLPGKWDELSYWPPGRPVNVGNGWSYTIAFFYILTRNFVNLTLEKFCVYFILFFVALTVIPAYLVGKIISNEYGGLATAFFILLAPTFITVSMAGYIDSDVVYVFYTYLCVFTTIFALKQWEKISFDSVKGFLKSLFKIFPYTLPALISYWVFAFNWIASWYIFFVFLLFGFVYFLFKPLKFFKAITLFLNAFSKTGFKEFISYIKTNFRKQLSILSILLLIFIISEIVTRMTSVYPFGTHSPLQQLLSGLRFIGKRGLIVNVSVAELQILNPFSREGFSQISSRIGLVAVVLALFGLPLIALYKFVYLKQPITFIEAFLIVWMLVSLWLISRGIRFSLLFSIAVAAASGFVIGNFIEIMNKLKFPNFLNSLLFSLILLSFLSTLSYSLQLSQFTGGMEISKDWRNALDFMKKNGDEYTLVATWWDPGHIIAGYTGLKVHADGAHCGWKTCIPYNHDIRIQDMGRILTTDNETEAYEILKKYTYLTKEDCEKIKKAFGDMFNESLCDIRIKKVYFIASADLIGKYYWPYYFASCLRMFKNNKDYCYSYEGIHEFFYKKKMAEGKSYLYLNFLQNTYKKYISQGITNMLPYGYSFNQKEYVVLDLVQKNATIIPVLKNGKIVSEIAFPSDNTTLKIDLTKLLKNKKPEDFDKGMVWIDPSFRVIIYMDEKIKNSMFTRMFFFNGEGLKHFKLVFNSPEVKIFEVNY